MDEFMVEIVRPSFEICFGFFVGDEW